MHEIYNLKDKLCKELEEYGSKDKMDVGALEIVDKLAHTIKNLDKIIEKYEEEEEYSNYDGQSGNMGGYSRRGYSRRGSSYYDGGSSYARGRGRSAKRDSMGRYSRRDDYSYENDMMLKELRELMEEAPDDKTRMEFEKFIGKMEHM